jgi:hypothetical protein
MVEATSGACARAKEGAEEVACKSGYRAGCGGTTMGVGAVADRVSGAAVDGVVEAGYESGCRAGCSEASLGVGAVEDIGMMGTSSSGGGTTQA